MRLSEAIRLGAMLRPQARLYWFHEGGSCALGAAAEAVGIAIYPDTFTQVGPVPREWIWINGLKAACPVCGDCDDAQETIKHLNNDHRWTRERIADWVETLEPRDEPVVALAALAKTEGTT